MSRLYYFAVMLAALLGISGLPAASARGWLPTLNPMSDPRWAPAYCLLNNGHEGLIAGGYSFPTDRCVATADVFDSRTRRFSRCRGHLNVPRNFAKASLLAGGEVLISGGYNTILGTLDSAELYDPAAQTFALLPARFSSPRELFSATTLLDGRVLFVGGFNTHRGRTQQTADIYDPVTHQFSPTGMLSDDRFGHDAVRLADGRVLVVGGTHWFVRQPTVTLASAEIYDPGTGQFHRTHSPMLFPRDRPTATLLADGHVLIAGGQNGAQEPPDAELFDPATETFSNVPSTLNTPRMAHSAVSMPDGMVLLAGGWSTALSGTTGTAELYDPVEQRFQGMFAAVPESGHDQALLVFPSGFVLIAGGKHVAAGRETSLASGYTRQFAPQNSYW